MSNYKYQTEINDTKEKIMFFHRKMRNQVDDLQAIHDEDEALHTSLLFFIDQAKNEGIEPTDAEELKKLLREADSDCQTLRGDIRTTIASF